jgi:hypothetical protein
MRISSWMPVLTFLISEYYNHDYDHVHTVLVIKLELLCPSQTSADMSRRPEPVVRQLLACKEVRHTRLYLYCACIIAAASNTPNSIT